MTLKVPNKYTTINFGDGGEITVRGLNFSDVVILVQTHRAKMEEIFSQFVGTDAKALTAEDTAPLLLQLMDKLPALANHVVCLGAEVSEQYNEVNDLPLDVKVEAITTIVNKTFAMQGGLKKMVQNLTSIAAVSTDQLKSLST